MEESLLRNLNAIDELRRSLEVDPAAEEGSMGGGESRDADRELGEMMMDSEEEERVGAEETNFSRDSAEAHSDDGDISKIGLGLETKSVKKVMQKKTKRKMKKPRMFIDREKSSADEQEGSEMEDFIDNSREDELEDCQRDKRSSDLLISTTRLIRRGNVVLPAETESLRRPEGSLQKAISDWIINFRQRMSSLGLVVPPSTLKNSKIPSFTAHSALPANKFIEIDLESSSEEDCEPVSDPNEHDENQELQENQESLHSSQLNESTSLEDKFDADKIETGLKNESSDVSLERASTPSASDGNVEKQENERPSCDLECAASCSDDTSIDFDLQNENEDATSEVIISDEGKTISRSEQNSLESSTSDGNSDSLPKEKKRRVLHKMREGKLKDRTEMEDRGNLGLLRFLDFEASEEDDEFRRVSDDLERNAEIQSSDIGSFLDEDSALVSQKNTGSMHRRVFNELMDSQRFSGHRGISFDDLSQSADGLSLLGAEKNDLARNSLYGKVSRLRESMVKNHTFDTLSENEIEQEEMEIQLQRQHAMRATIALKASCQSRTDRVQETRCVSVYASASTFSKFHRLPSSRSDKRRDLLTPKGNVKPQIVSGDEQSKSRISSKIGHSSLPMAKSSFISKFEKERDRMAQAMNSKSMSSLNNKCWVFTSSGASEDGSDAGPVHGSENQEKNTKRKKFNSYADQASSQKKSPSSKRKQAHLSVFDAMQKRPKPVHG